MVYFPPTIDALILVLLSGIATGIIVLLSLNFTLYKQPLSLMVLAINLAHIFFYYSKLSVLFYQPRNELHCKVLGILHVFGLEPAAFWGALFAHAFYTILKQPADLEARVASMIKYYFIFAVLYPLIAGTVSFFTTSFSLFSR